MAEERPRLEATAPAGDPRGGGFETRTAYGGALLNHPTSEGFETRTAYGGALLNHLRGRGGYARKAERPA